ncbi:MAG: GatB/YqeY domain-containing protein [Candidatus Dojkabacteria bacterium]|nr:MAG: GatB/YqeY domain-containing protein [Candidatus Dojkabacteria bacterium]
MASGIIDQLRTDTFQAVKDGDEMKAGIARLAMAAVKNAEIEKGSEFTDEEVQNVLRKEAKKLSDSIEQFNAAGREELVSATQGQLDYLNSFLPAMMSEEEVGAVVDAVIKESGAAGPQDMGRVMGQAMGRLKGQADGGVVKSVVEQKLAAL